MQVSVLLKGTLRGMGREGECELVARKTPAAERGRFDYTEVAVIRAPSGFPDGDYTLIFEGVVVSVRHRAVLWTIENETAQSAGSAAATEEPEQFATGVLREAIKIRRRDRRSRIPAMQNEQH